MIREAGDGPRRGAAFYLRLLVSLLLIFYLLEQVSWSAFREVILKADLFYIVLSFALTPLLILVSVWKWRLLLAAKGYLVSSSELFKLYLVGYFFNNLLPTNIGGDLVRAYRLGKKVNDQSQSAASVLMERFTGVSALVILAALSFFANLGLVGDLRIGLALLLVSAGYFALFWLAVDDSPLLFLESRIRHRSISSLIEKLRKVQNAVKAYNDNRRILLLSVFISFIFYILAIINVYVSSLAFGAAVSIASLAVIVPLILLISMLPLSIGGIGLQEWAYFFTFSQVGIAGTVGLSVALLMRLKGVVWGIFGGAMYGWCKG